MAQIQSPETYADGQQVTAARLNNQTNGAILLPGAVTDQTAIATNTVASGDQVILHDASASALRRATASDLLSSNIPVVASSVTTAAVNAPASGDVVVSANDGITVSGLVFSSVNGALVTVTSNAHGLSSGQVVQVTASIAAYNGVYSISVTGVDTFTYTIATAVTPASGTCSYIKRGTEVVNGNISVSQNQYVAGSSTIAGNSTTIGNSLVKGTQSVEGQSTFSVAPMLVNTAIRPRLDYFVQTREIATFSCTWGGLQNLANPFGTKIPQLDLTFTPQKAGNTVVLDWSIFGEGYFSHELVFVVTRTPNSGAGAGVPVALPNAVDASNNTWSGVTTGGHDANDATTPSTIRVRIIDFNSLDVACTYSVHVRSTVNRTNYWHLNRPINGSGGALDLEVGLSIAHAHEIYT